MLEEKNGNFEICLLKVLSYKLMCPRLCRKWICPRNPATKLHRTHNLSYSAQYGSFWDKNMQDKPKIWGLDPKYTRSGPQKAWVSVPNLLKYGILSQIRIKRIHLNMKVINWHPLSVLGRPLARPISPVFCVPRLWARNVYLNQPRNLESTFDPDSNGGIPSSWNPLFKKLVSFDFWLRFGWFKSS